LKEIKVGVRELLEMVFLPQDLNTKNAASARGTEGTEGHQFLTGKRPEGYRREVTVKFCYEGRQGGTRDYRLIVQGRADGLYEESGTLVVEEIKTTYLNLADITLDENGVHAAQLKLYMYFFSENEQQPTAGRLTYLNLDTLEEKSFTIQYSATECRRLFERMAEAFLATLRNRDQWAAIRNQSLRALEFPFDEQRVGQDELMDLVALAIDQERDLIAEAATGIGKTIAVLFPALKRLCAGDRYDQIFFLTAKTAGKEIVRKTIAAAMEKGLRLRTVFIEAKERVCLSPGSRCHPTVCPYAARYYEKAREVLPTLLAEELILPEAVAEVARAAEACPFELTLDLTLHADLIVCDYNYVFDPRVYLKRFFMTGAKGRFLFLVDEAHNLVSRGRDMYSATLSRSDLAALLNETGTNGGMDQACDAVDQFFGGWRKEMEQEERAGVLMRRLPEMLPPSLERLLDRTQKNLPGVPMGPMLDRLLELYFKISDFNRIVSMINEHYALYVKKEDGDDVLHLQCLNPGPLLRKRLDFSSCTLFFSATLSPFDYFQELLGAKPDALNARLTSPFPQENRLYLHIPGVDTRYRARTASIGQVARCAIDMAKSHYGNYLVFFPSYTYLRETEPYIKAQAADKIAVYTQRPAMTERQKQEFIRRVTANTPGRSNLGLAVLGGLFGEAVDLPGDKLVGVMIVGPGLPGLSDEQELIRMYFDERNGNGFFYAYLVPGLIKVIQSAGRVFRTPDDKGVVLLIDDRFADERYTELLPPDWFMPGRPFSTKDYRSVLADFWKN
jgi:DNA excision repair protein ERCC-2